MISNRAIREVPFEKMGQKVQCKLDDCLAGATHIPGYSIQIIDVDYDYLIECGMEFNT